MMLHRKQARQDRVWLASTMIHSSNQDSYKQPAYLVAFWRIPAQQYTSLLVFFFFFSFKPVSRQKGPQMGTAFTKSCDEEGIQQTTQRPLFFTQPQIMSQTLQVEDMEFVVIEANTENQVESVVYEENLEESRIFR